MHQQLGRNGELGIEIAAVRAAKLPRCGLDGGEERSVHDELEMAYLRNETGRKGVVDVNLGGAHHMGLRQREVDVVLPVDAVQLNLRGTGVGKGEFVAILAGRNGRILAGSAALRARRQSPACCACALGAPAASAAARKRIPTDRAMESEVDLRDALSLSPQMLRNVAFRPRMEIWKMRPRLRSTLSLSRASPQPSQESARE